MVQNLFARYRSILPNYAPIAVSHPPSGSRAAQPYPGFDAHDYLELNPDVAAALGQVKNIHQLALRHFVNHGAGEMRRVRLDNVGIEDTESRMLTGTARAAWFDGLQGIMAARGLTLAAVLETHPRAAWLWTGFSPLAYADQHPELVRTTADLLALSFHFLEIGLENGWYGRPDLWDRQIVRQIHDTETDAGIPDAVGALSRIRARNKRDLIVALTEAELMTAAGMNGAMLASAFDHQFYHAKLNAAHIPSPPPDRISCLRHFCETGRHCLMPVAPDLGFDAEFYRDTYRAQLLDTDSPALRNLTRSKTLTPEQSAVLYNHWLGAGSQAGASPNLVRWLAQEHGIALPEAVVDQLPKLRLGLDRNSAALTDAQLLAALIDEPRPLLGRLDLRDAAVVAFVNDLAELQDRRHARDKVEWLCWLVLENNPDDPRAGERLANQVQDTGRHSEALTLRERILPSRAAVWNVLNLSKLQADRGRFADAARSLIIARDCSAGEVATQAYRKQCSTELFSRIWEDVGRISQTLGIAPTQEALRLALEAASPAMDGFGARRHDPIRRVALVGNEDLPQCRLYRLDQKAEQLAAAGIACETFPYTTRLADFRARLKEFDAVIFFRVPAFPDVIDAITSAADYGLATFYEVDDLIFAPEHFPPAYETYANQITPEHYAAMACGVPLFEHAMRLCDYGIASTATIRALMADRVRTGLVFEHHNALGRVHLDAMKTPRHRTSSRLRIVYASGTRAHKQDFHDILEPALAEIANRFPDRIEILLIGHFDQFRHLDPRRHPVTLQEPSWDFSGYLTALSECDINLSVLEASLLTDAKSEIKWMEAALFAIPSVLSDTRTHRETVEDGVTGLLAHDAAGFTAAIASLVTDPQRRRQIGEAARQKVLGTYGLDQMSANLRQIFDSVRPGPAGKSRKRIVIVNVFYPPQAIGGATRVVHDNVTGLVERYGDEFDIDVICTLEGGQTPYEVNVYGTGKVRVWAVTAGNLPAIDSQPEDRRMAGVVARLFDILKPDLIHFHCIQRLTASVAEAALARNIPYVITAHDAWWISPNQFVLDQKGESALYDYKAQPLDGRAARLARPLLGAQAVLAVSESFAQLYRDCGLDHIRTIANGVSALPRVTRTVSRSGKVRLAHIGGVSPHKGFHHVRNAFMANAFENLELLIIDHALPPGVICHEIWGTTQVTRRGKFSQKDVADLYAAMDILLAPSTWPESFGLVTREALASGVWVIASDQGAIGQDIVEGVNGHVVRVDSYQPLADLLRRIDAHPERYLHSPEAQPALRTAEDQLDDLVGLYREISRA